MTLLRRGRVLIITLTFLTHIGCQSAEIIDAHPRLILDNRKIEDLRQSITGTHSHLWEMTRESANDFSNLVVPGMQDSHNKYRYMGHTLPSLGLCYIIIGDQHYLDASERWLKTFLAVPEWSGSQNLGRGSWSIATALLYDWLYAELDEELRAEIRTRLTKEAKLIMDDSSYWRALSNHLLIETAALGLIGLTLSGEVDESATFLKQADDWSRYIIDHAPTDGSWGEGVQYWQYGLSHFMLFLEAAKTSEYHNYYPEYNWLEKTGYFPINFSLPGKPLEVLNFSDCNSDCYKPPFILYQLASVYSNGHFQDYGDRLLKKKPHKFSWMDFIVYDPSVAARNIHELPTLHHFEDTDFVSMRSSWGPDATMIGFRSGPAAGHRNQADPTLLEFNGFGPGHGHPDINSFSLYAFGQWLAIDPGYTHLKLTANHNTILANGYDQAGAGEKWLDYLSLQKREPAAAILRIESNPVYDYVIGDAGNIYVDEARLKSYRRHLLFLKPSVVVIADDVEGTDEGSFEWLLHGDESIAKIARDQYEITKGKVRLWVNPILPGGSEITISERELDASDIDGRYLTLNLKIESIRQTRYLVVLCALPDETAPVPTVQLAGNLLEIRLNGQAWTIQIVDSAQLQKPSDPVLVVQQPVASSPDYSFLREAR